jgi:hypothetical protein
MSDMGTLCAAARPNGIHVRDASGPIMDTADSPKPASKLHTAPSRIARRAEPASRAPSSVATATAPTARPRTPRSHRLRISPDHSMSPAPRRSADLASASPTARRTRGASDPRRPGSGGSGRRTLVRCACCAAQADMTHTARRVAMPRFIRGACLVRARMHPASRSCAAC